jgi:hypothetical protein
VRLRINSPFNHTIRPERLKRRVSLIGKSLISLNKTTRARRRRSTKMRSARNSSLRSSPVSNPHSPRPEPSQLPMPPRSMMALAQSLLWLKRLLRSVD